MLTVPSQQIIDFVQCGCRDVNGINRSIGWQSYAADQFLCEIPSRRIDSEYRNPIQKDKSFLCSRRITSRTFVHNGL